MTQYHCPALVDCPRADARELFDLPTASNNKCPTCQSPLVPAVQPGAAAPAGGGSKKTLLAGGGAVVLALAAAGAWYLSHRPAAAPASATAPAPAAAAPAAAPPAEPAAASNGIVPDAAETAALKRQGETQLVSGAAGDAELASSKAAANELIKLAVAKLAQGKLEDAEKDLLAAKEKDPRQSLVNYNLGVLRLRQNRTDDALKELEASFMKGFPYFDQLAQDSDLAPLRKDARFAALLKRYQPAK
jgi:hypothetical protein